MDNFELKPEPKVKRKSIIWNLLTILVLLFTCYLAYYFLTVFLNPNSIHNPFPPAALPTLFQTPTETPTIIPKQPTWTPTETNTPVSTRTKAPTWTLVKLVTTPTVTTTPTPTATLGTVTLTPTAMPATAAITYQSSVTIHPDLACNWLGVGGKVLDAENQPLLFQTIQLGGKLNDTVVNGITISGSNTAYGTSGFEFEKLADKPIASTHTLWVQLFDNNGKPLTDKVYFDTSANCDTNLVQVVFTKH